MIKSITRNCISILLGAMFLTLGLYPVATASAQDSPLNNVLKLVQEAGSYRFVSTIDHTLLPRAIPEMTGQQEQRLRTTMSGAARLPDHAYIEMWVESGARQVPTVVLIRDGIYDFLQVGGELKAVENPFGALLPSGDWLGYLHAAKDVHIIEPQPGDAEGQTHFRFEIDGARLSAYLQEQAEAALRKEPGAPAELRVATSPLLARLTGQGELWVGADGLPTRQVLDLNIPMVSNAYDAQLHVIVGMHDYGQVEDLPRAVPGRDGTWQLQSVTTTPPDASSGSPGPSRVHPVLHVAYPDLISLWLCLIFASLVILYRRYPRQTYAMLAILTVLLLIVGPPLESAQTAGFMARQAQAAASQESTARDLAAALGFELSTDRPLEGLASEMTDAENHQTGEEQPAIQLPRSLADAKVAQVPAPAEDNESALIDSCGEGDPGKDFDQDGLSDFDEGCYGTDPYDVDTDNDTITDTLEIQGFDWPDGSDRHWTGDALNADSNHDGLLDVVEWPAPVGEAGDWDVDGDGEPNIWDDDNDGDRVPDSIDLSPFAAGDYASNAPLSIEVWDRDRQGYQYIEFQLQPRDANHLRYSTTWLDWPDNDTKGQVTSLVNNTQDLRLVPFLEVTTNESPVEELCNRYGLSLMHETGKDDHLLIPLFPQGVNGAVDNFYGKVVYGPDTQEQVRWTEMRLVWLVQNVDSKGKSGVIHRYEDDFRLTGMQVSTSDGYELGVFGTPDKPQEDGTLFKVLFGMSATFLEYERLEGQSAATVLQEVASRFDQPDPEDPYIWGIAQKVASSVKTFGHQDEALNVSGKQVNDFLAEHFARQGDLCSDSNGYTFECAGVVVGTEERLRAIPVESLDGPEVRVDMTGIETFTSRSLRYQMYQRTGLQWEAVSLARTLEVMEARYRDQWGVSLADYLEETPYLIEDDLRFATYLGYQAWTAGRQSLISIGEDVIVPQRLDYKGVVDLFDDLGDIKDSIYDVVMEYIDLDDEINELRKEKLKWESEEISLEDALKKLPIEKLDLDQKLKKEEKRLKKMAITSTAVEGAALAITITGMICDATEGCSEEVLEGFVKATEIASMVLDTYDLIKDLKAPLASMTKMAKAAAIVGLVVEIALIWTQFFLTMGDKFSGFQFDLALGTAIVATIFAIVSFVLLLIPGVNIVAGIVLLFVGFLDLLLWLFGSDLSIMGAVMDFFYSVKMVTSVEEGSAKYLGGGSGLLYQDMGVTPGNTFIITDTFTAIIKGSRQLGNSTGWAEWHGVPVPGVISATDLNVKPPASNTVRTRKTVTNTVGVNFKLEKAQPDLLLGINTNIHFTLRYKKCVFLGICWYDTDNQDIDGNFDVVMDVLPKTVGELWEWDEITNPDPDGDGLINEEGPNKVQWDSDDDGLGDRFELDNRAQLKTDPAQADRDQDGLDDGREISLGTSPGVRDSDGDGLSDGEEINGWEVLLPSGLAYWIYSDPAIEDADGDGLTDKMERDNQTSPIARNAAPTLRVEAQPLSAGPYGQMGVYLEPGAPVTMDLALQNTGDRAVTTTLQISLTNAVFSGIEVSAAGAGDGSTPSPEQVDCGEATTCYRWDFGALAGDGTPYLLPVGKVFTATIAAVAEGPGGSGVMTYTLPYKDMTLSGVLDVMVIVDTDTPSATLTAPAPGEGALLTGQYYVAGGSASDETTWIKDIELLVDTDPGEKVAFGQLVELQHALGAWSYTWALPADGNYRLATRAYDLFNNESEMAQTDVVVDNTPPEVDFAPGLSQAILGPEDGQIMMSGKASDNLSGLDRVQVRVDGGSWQQATLTPAPDPETRAYPQEADWGYRWSVYPGAQGNHSLDVRGLDRLGNVSAEGHIQFVVDMVPPAVALTGLEGEMPLVKADPVVILSGYTDDAGNIPIPPSPVPLQGEIDVVADATVWLAPGSIEEDDGGVSLVWAGDLDGDRKADLVLGFPASAGGAGKVVVLYGRYSDWRLPPQVESLAETATSFVGAPGAGLGSHIAAVGDMNGDGLDDLLVGDSAHQRAFLVYSRPYPMGREQILDGNKPRPVLYTLFKRSGDQPLADSVAPAGDFNGDGLADMWIGTAERTYLILGDRDLPLKATVTVDDAAAAVVTIPAGGAVTGVGDVNGDQVGDWVVSDPENNRLYLLRGSQGLSVSSRRAIDPKSDALLLKTLESEGLGMAGVAALGDVNDDGLADFIYGSGEAPRLVLGRVYGEWDFDYEFKDYLPAADGFLVAPGDVDGDGKADLMLGTGEQSAYLILGRTSWSGEVDIEATILGVVGTASSPLAADSDLNCDRSADLLLLPTEAGVSYLLKPDWPFDTSQGDKQEVLTNTETLYVDDDYCDTCANDGLTWGVNAFASIQAGLDAAADRVTRLGEALETPVTVRVGPGVYTECLTLPSHVRLVGAGADDVKLECEASEVISVVDVADIAILGLHITHAGIQPGTGIGVASSRDILITRNLIEGFGQGVVFEGGATGLVTFNTLVNNRDAGLLVSGTGSWASAQNNIVYGSQVGLVSEKEGMVFSDYNLLSTSIDYEDVKAGDGDIQDEPGFIGDYHPQASSPAVDAADPGVVPPAGGGSRADIGYYEVRTAPLTLLFGQPGTSCAEGNSGTSQVEIALIPVTDASLQITKTLPVEAQWQAASLETPGQLTSNWSATIEAQRDGLHRLYTRATDVVGNRVYDDERWYSGAVLLDTTPPVVSWVNPMEDLTVSDLSLRLQAQAADWLDMGAGQLFSVREVRFVVNGVDLAAAWAQDDWVPQEGAPRSFEALALLSAGANEITAVATDLADHEVASKPIVVTSTISGNAVAITSILDGSTTHQRELEVSGYARYTQCSGMQRRVLVELDGGEPAEINLDADFVSWSVPADLGSEGQHTIKAYATCSVDPSERGTPSQVKILFDNHEPALVIVAPADGALVPKMVTLKGTVTDSDSGVASVEISVDGGYKWEKAKISAEQWSYTLTAPDDQDGVTYKVRVRAMDRVGNTAIQTRAYIVDSEPPVGIEPLVFNIPPNTHLEGVTNVLEASWQPAIDSSGLVTVTATIDPYTSITPTQVMGEEHLAAILDSGGEWYFHLLVQDATGNGFLYHEGPWYVDTFETGKSIAIDGFLDLDKGEWRAETDFLDDDERALAGVVPGLFNAERQFLYTTWDNEALYLGWRGAWWDLHGTMWAFVGAAAGGSRQAPIAGLPRLPFDADYAIQISGSADGKLWVYGDAEWQVSERGMIFAHGGSGDTEVKLPLDLSQAQEISLVALAIDDAGTPWSSFPTTNPLDRWVDVYQWEDLDTAVPNASQPVGTRAIMAVSSRQAPQGFWSPGSEIPYPIEVKNWEKHPVDGLQITLEPSDGLTVLTTTVDLPVLDSGQSYAIEVNGRLEADLGSLTGVDNTISLQLGGDVLHQVVTRYPVDGLAPELQINVPPDNVIGAGTKSVSGTAVDGEGSGVVRVEVWENGAWRTAVGASEWTANVTVTAGDRYTLQIRATDATGNTREASHTYAVDAVPPTLEFSLPALLSGDEFVLLGTVKDEGSRAVRVEVQLEGAGEWLPVAGPFQPDDAGTQDWLFRWDLPQEDHTGYRLRVRAVDVAGNEMMSDWYGTHVDTVAPNVVVETTLAEGVLSEYDADKAGRNPAPIVSGTLSDEGGVASVVARIQMPNGVEVISPAVLEGNDFRITPTFKNPVSGEYSFTIEATDQAGNRTALPPFVFTGRAPEELIDQEREQELTRVEIVNKTDQAVSMVISAENANYVLEVAAHESRRFIVAKANYSRTTYACGVSDNGFLIVTKQIRLVFTPCGSPPPNMGEPSMEKIHFSIVPKGKRWLYK